MLENLFIVKKHNGYVSLMNHLTGEMFYRKVDKKEQIMLKNKKVSLETFEDLTKNMMLLKKLEMAGMTASTRYKDELFPLELLNEEKGLHVYVSEGELQISGMPLIESKFDPNDLEGLKYAFRKLPTGSIKMDADEGAEKVFFATTGLGEFFADLGTNVFYTNGPNGEMFKDMSKDELKDFLVRHSLEVSENGIVEFAFYQRQAGYYIHLKEEGKPFETTKKMFLEREQNNFDLKLPLSLQEMAQMAQMAEEENEKKTQVEIPEIPEEGIQEGFVCPF